MTAEDPSSCGGFCSFRVDSICAVQSTAEAKLIEPVYTHGIFRKYQKSSEGLIEKLKAIYGNCLNQEGARDPLNRLIRQHNERYPESNLEELE